MKGLMRVFSGDLAMWRGWGKVAEGRVKSTVDAISLRAICATMHHEGLFLPLLMPETETTVLRKNEIYD